MCGAARRERVFHSHSLSTTPFSPLNSRNAKKRRRAPRSPSLSFLVGSHCPSWFLSGFKRRWTRCLWLVKRPGQTGCASGSAPGGSLRGPRGGRDAASCQVGRAGGISLHPSTEPVSLCPGTAGDALEGDRPEWRTVGRRRRKGSAGEG